MTMYSNNIWEEIKLKYSTGGMLIKLIMVNVAVFLLLNLINVFGYIATSDKHWMDVYVQLIAMPAFFPVLKTQPWSLFTNMFSHMGLMHILFNMYMLYIFGQFFNNFIGESKLLPFYLLSGLAGAITYIIVFQFIPIPPDSSGYALGASAAVTAIVVAVGVMVPNYSLRLLLFGVVRLKWIAIAVVVMSFISMPKGNAGGQIAHLGGALFGFAFTLLYKDGTDLTKPLYVIWDGLKSFFDFSAKPKKRKPTKKSEVKMAYKNEEKIRQKQSGTAPSQPTSNKEKQELIDDILDKIGKSGYPSLSEEEKAFLFKYSKE